MAWTVTLKDACVRRRFFLRGWEFVAVRVVLLTRVCIAGIDFLTNVSISFITCLAGTREGALSVLAVSRHIAGRVGAFIDVCAGEGAITLKACVTGAGVATDSVGAVGIFVTRVGLIAGTLIDVCAARRTVSFVTLHALAQVTADSVFTVGVCAAWIVVRRCTFINICTSHGTVAFITALALTVVGSVSVDAVCVLHT